MAIFLGVMLLLGCFGIDCLQASKTWYLEDEDNAVFFSSLISWGNYCEGLKLLISIV